MSSDYDMRSVTQEQDYDDDEEGDDDVFTPGESGGGLPCKEKEKEKERNYSSMDVDFYDNAKEDENGNTVFSLGNYNFKRFVDKNDIAVVLFHGVLDCKTRKALDTVNETSTVTKRENHAYGTVNCLKEKQLCANQFIRRVPMIGVFSRGERISAYEDKDLNKFMLKDIVEKSKIS